MDAVVAAIDLKNLCASLTSSDLASLKILPSLGSGSPCVAAYLSRDHSPKSPASSPPMPLSLCHRLVAVAVLSPKYPVGSSSR